MKNKNSKKKLVINKLTVSNLDMAQQKAVKGGIETVNCTQVLTCHCPYTGGVCLSEFICL
ncbi:MAG: hypothetical protein GY950_22350 [bacterium]|nr:hypothetical protein [bacterium]